MLNQLFVIAPEIMLFSLAVLMQIIAVFTRHQHLIFKLTCLIASFIIYYLFTQMKMNISVFAASFSTSPILALFKGLILILTFCNLLIYYGQNQANNKPFRFEFVTLILLATLGIFITISANNLLLLFCGLELQALSGYALASFNTKQIKSSEAGLKYFILGALMSCLMLFGISFLYGFSGTINFSELAKITTMHQLDIGLITGLILLLAGIFFKLSAAPLHIWTPDIYEGAPIAAVSFFATSQKLGLLFVLINLLEQLIPNYPPLSVNLIKFIAVTSMLVGSLGALGQKSLKRLMGYSTILNIGYALIAVATNNAHAQYFALVYLFIYSLATIGFFACLVIFLGHKSDEAIFTDLTALAAKHKLAAATIVIIIFSMIGLPPLAGFFGKYLIFYQAMQQGEFILAIIGILTSVIAAFYYLKIIKYIYFVSAEKEQIEKETKPILVQNSLYLLIIVTSFCLIFFFTLLKTVT